MNPTSCSLIPERCVFGNRVNFGTDIFFRAIWFSSYTILKDITKIVLFQRQVYDFLFCLAVVKGRQYHQETIMNQRFSWVDLHFTHRTGISSNGIAGLQSKQLFFSRLRIMRKYVILTPWPFNHILELWKLFWSYGFFDQKFINTFIPRDLDFNFRRKRNYAN